MTIKMPIKILSRESYEAKEAYIDHLENMVSELKFELSKYDRLRDENGRFISDREGLVRMLQGDL